MAKRKVQNLIKGSANHSRTEGDYMSTLLETVTLDDWQEVIKTTLTAAKQGDPQEARAWLGQYLVGKPAFKAPTPLTVVVNQLNGDNPLINRLATPVINQQKFGFDKDDVWEGQVKAIIAQELAEKLKDVESIPSP